VVALALEAQLEVGDEGVGGIAQAVLHAAQGGGVDLLTFAGDGAHVEDDRDGIDLGLEAGPGGAQQARAGGGVAVEQGGRDGAAIGQHDVVVEGEAQQLGKARLARAVEARDPGGGQLGAAGAVELVGDGGQQVDVLLVDALGYALPVGVLGGVAAGDDVLTHLGGHLLGALLVEVHHRGDGAGDVGGKEFADFHVSRLPPEETRGSAPPR
jgi:hypothetical protein